MTKHKPIKARIAGVYRPRIEQVALTTKRSLNQVVNLVFAEADGILDRIEGGRAKSPK